MIEDIKAAAQSALKLGDKETYTGLMLLLGVLR